MSYFVKISLFVFMFLSVNALKANTGNNPETGGNNDTAKNIKSNIVIFKLITAPKAGSSASNSGSLKKAGKAARTSNQNISTNRKLSFNEG